MSENEVSRRKAALRLQMKRLLALESSGAARDVGQAIADRLGAAAEWAHARTIAVFASLRDEVDTGPLVARARSEGKDVLYPRIRQRTELEFARVETHSQLVDGPFGIREPASTCRLVSLSESDLVLVPGLAFDRRGGRLGRGAGYYDRALAQRSASEGPGCRIGIAYAFQLIEHVPMTLGDVRIDGVVTEVEFVRVEEFER